MNQAEFSKHIGKSRTTVTRFKKEGLLVIGTNGIDAEKSIKKLIASGRLEQPQEPKPTQPTERVVQAIKKPIQPQQEQLTDIELVTNFYSSIIKGMLEGFNRGNYNNLSCGASYDGEQDFEVSEQNKYEQFRERFRKDFKTLATKLRNGEELGQELKGDDTNVSYHIASVDQMDRGDEFIWGYSLLRFEFALAYWEKENPTAEEKELLKLHPHTYTP